jgi:3-oxoacyl-[acyl-carrier-protein] synthase III
MAGEEEFSIDLAAKAVARCLERSKYSPEDIELLICCNISRQDAPGRFSFEPCTSIKLVKQFGFRNAICFDVGNACAGMFTAIHIVDSFVGLGLIRRGLVVSGEYITHLTKTAQEEIEGFMDPRLGCLTLGDSGACLLLEKAPSENVGFQELDLYTLGRYSSYCIAKPTDQPHGGAIMRTDMIRLASVAIPAAIESWERVQSRTGSRPTDFKHFIMHQTSRKSLRGAMREFNRACGERVCDGTNTIDNLAERGNTATTSHFVAVVDQILKRKIHSGDRAFFSVTASGLTVGTALYSFDDFPDRLRGEVAVVSPEGTRTDQSDRRGLAQVAPRSRIRIESFGVLPRQNKVPLSTISLARTAAEDCLRKSSYQRQDISLLLFAGVYRSEFISEPAIATLLAGELRLNEEGPGPMGKTTLAFDVFNGAMSFLNACHVGAQMIRTKKYRNSLIVASEIDNNRLSHCGSLGVKETGSAVILDESADGRTGFGGFVFRHDGRYSNAYVTWCSNPNGVARLHVEKKPAWEEACVSCAGAAVRELMKLEGLETSRIKVVFPPQLSYSFLVLLSEATSISLDRFIDLTGEGNDVYTSSFPYALQMASEQQLVGSGDTGLIIGVGSGLQAGCAVYYF